MGKARKGNDGGVKFAIHEDAPGLDEPRKIGRAQPIRQSMMISQPPQRPRTKKRVSIIHEPKEEIPQRVSLPFSQIDGLNQQGQRASSPTIKAVQTQNQSHTQSSATENRKLNAMPRRPTSVKVQDDPTLLLPDFTEPTTVLKPPRRGTIYIPTEDTTMPSMYMGIFSPIKHVSLSSVAEISPHEAKAKEEIETEVTGIAAQMAAKNKTRDPRRSMITLSPRRGRGPLQLSSRNLQDTAIQEDRVGSGPGKENVPPGQEQPDRTSGKKIDKTVVPKRKNIHAREHEGRASTSASTLCQQTASSTGRVTGKKTASRAPRPVWNSGWHVKSVQSIPVRTASPVENLAPQEQEVVARKLPVPSRFVIPSLKSEMQFDMAYPLLTEDLACPAMYEDSWLSHQEIAITQLVNNLFASSSQISSAEDNGMLRSRLLQMYGSPENAVLYKRMQAALLYGALSAPTEVLKSASQLSADLGKKNAFVSLWLDTYDLTCLRAAMEVVVGRQCSICEKDHHASRHSVRQFIEAFLIRDEDGRPGSEFYTAGREAWSYHRTLLRSMMVIKILDMVKTTLPQVVSGCLFRSTSTYKTSAGVVRGLFQLLNPSAGDPIRALSHIGYNVTHEQYPLQEYAYRVDNLAVDLRDGVRLTRLVELLLYPSASGLGDNVQDIDSTTTVALPTGEELSLVDGPTQWPLSQHLKFPCASRAAKMYNVQIALSALQGVQGIAGLVQNVQAEDIVDGHREKTVKLLWGLTSKWGLGSLIDCHDVELEIKRLCRLTGNYDNEFFHAIEDDEEEEEPDHVRYKLLLKAWAQAVAGKKGLVVKNLTTSFADGKVFEAIVDEYEGYISNQLGKGQPLSLRLRRLGCSEQFSGVFATGQEARSCAAHIFDRDFVLAALAFLCSRLLGPTRGVRAAVTLQKAWRSHWNKVVASRKTCLKAVAQGCAEVVVGQWNNQDAAAVARKKGLVGHDAVLNGGDEAHEEDIWLGL